jgi:adenylate kinase
VYLVLLGAPGSGKGTQGIIIAERLNLVHVATGHLLREEVEKETELGRQAGSYMERGELVPNDLVIAMVLERLSRPDAVNQGAILDGFPRSLPQADALDEALHERGARVDAALFLDVPEPILVRRLARRIGCAACGALYHEETHPPRIPGICNRCGWGLSHRLDDRPATVQRRFQIYMEMINPLLDYYSRKGVLVHLDGQLPVPEVTQRILTAAGTKVG